MDVQIFIIKTNSLVESVQLSPRGNAFLQVVRIIIRRRQDFHPPGADPGGDQSREQRLEQENLVELIPASFRLKT